MNFSETTKKILINFSSINPSIEFKPGNSVRTISPSRSMLAEATIAESIEHNFAIYDLRKFLRVIEMFDEPSFDYSNNAVIISDATKRVKYNFTAVDNITVPPNKNISLKSEDVIFEITADQFKSVMKGASTLGLNAIGLIGDGQNIFIQALDPNINSKSDDASESFSVKIGETDKNFRLIFNPENFKFMEANYTVSINGQNKITQWKSDNLCYWVPAEQKSTFEG